MQTAINPVLTKGDLKAKRINIACAVLCFFYLASLVVQLRSWINGSVEVSLHQHLHEVVSNLAQLFTIASVMPRRTWLRVTFLGLAFFFFNGCFWLYF